MRPLLLITVLYAVMSLLTFLAYGLDKRRAERGQWRLRERTLHLLELAGGWPGAFMGKTVFHHKTRKLGFRLVSWAIVLVHGLAWIGFYCINGRF